MKNIMTITVVAVFALALTACGGGGSSSGNTLSRPDEGIWSNLDSTAAGASPGWMQSVILSDGSYWGIYGIVNYSGAFMIERAFHGAASATSSNGNNISGTFTDFVFGNGTFSGTASAQTNLNLAFNDSSTGQLGGTGVSFSMSYDSIYNQPASLAAIQGNYLSGGYDMPGDQLIPLGGFINYSDTPNLTISGSNLTLDVNGNVVMTGTITPYGTTVNVFAVSLTTTPTTTIPTGIVGGPPYAGAVLVGTTYQGILFQTSSGLLKNYIEILTRSAGNSNFFFIGSKQS
jgi:hypothetical protein